MPRPNPLLPVIVIAIVLLFARLGATSLFQVAEARNSEVPVEMMQSGNYVVPYFNGVLRTDKPPLHYYAMLLAYRVAGVSEGSARFFSAVCGLLLIVSLFLFVRKNANTESALGACLVLLASLHTILQFRLATPDPYLVTCHALSLMCFWEGYRHGRKPYLLLMYVLLGLAVLAKGPVGLVLPLATVFLYWLIDRLWKTNKPLQFAQLGIGLLIILAISLPWYWLVHKQTGGAWTDGFFMRHNVSRFSRPMDGHRGLFLLTWLFVLAGLFPFSLFFFRAIGFALRQGRQNAWLFFNLVAGAIVVFAYSLSATKLINYTVPAYPFLAVIIAVYLHHHLEQGAAGRKLWPEWIFLLLTSIAMPVVAFFMFQQEAELADMTASSALLIALPLFVIAGLYLHTTGRRKEGLVAVAAGSIIQNLLFFLFLFPGIDSRGSVVKMKEMLQEKKTVVAYRAFNDAFTFYHGQPIPVLDSASAVRLFLQRQPDALILEREGAPVLKDSIPGLTIIAIEPDLFSGRSSIIYQWKPE